MDKDTLIELKNVGVSFSSGSIWKNAAVMPVLKDISFEVKRGESIGILGRNGVGKSTLLKLMAGIIAPDEGVITKGDSVSCALLNLQLGFDQELNGIDNIYLLGVLLGCPREKIRSNMEKIISFSELGGAINRPLKGYSSGMKARLGFAVALEMQTDVLLIDEVMGVGDVVFREKSSAALRKKIQSEQTVVLVSHQAPTVKSLCTKAVWIENGVIHKVGDAVEVVDTFEKYLLDNSSSIK